MKIDEVPQDPGFLDGLQRANYAVGEDGRYVVVASPGWEAERAATEMALLEQDRFLRAAWEAVQAGRRSPLAYHFARRQLTTGLAAQGAGLSRLRVWWQLRPRGFAAMSAAHRRRWAEFLQLPEEEMGRVPKEPESFLTAPEPHG